MHKVNDDSCERCCSAIAIEMRTSRMSSSGGLSSEHTAAVAQAASARDVAGVA